MPLAVFPEARWPSVFTLPSPDASCWPPAGITPGTAATLSQRGPDPAVLPVLHTDPPEAAGGVCERGPIVGAGPLWGVSPPDLCWQFLLFGQQASCTCEEGSRKPEGNAEMLNHTSWRSFGFIQKPFLSLSSSHYSCWRTRSRQSRRGQKYKRAWFKGWRKIKRWRELK